MNRVIYIRITPKKHVALFTKRISSKASQNKIEESYHLLNVPVHSKQDIVRKAFLDLAKKYHPDSGSPEANIDKFVAIENAFRILSKHNTGSTCSEEIETIVYDIKHTAPQHRQYLSYEGAGHGTPAQRERQWAQARAQRAAVNVMEHRVAKAVASENTLMKKGQHKKHDIKTKYGFDRLVEDYIQESMSKGEFDNLSGKGKPLKNQNRNPYVDFTTHKLNEVLINNGFTPEWITMNKEINQDIELLKKEIGSDRMTLGPYPLCEKDQIKWAQIKENNRNLAKTINTKINTYNLIVPLINKQKLHVEFEKICDEILKNGINSLNRTNITVEKRQETQSVVLEEDVFGLFFKALGQLIAPSSQENKKEDK